MSVIRRRLSRLSLSDEVPVSHGVCPACKKMVLERYDLMPAVKKYCAGEKEYTPEILTDQTRKLEEEVIKEEIGLEKDLARMIKRISFIEDKHEKHAYLKAARRVINLLLESWFIKLAEPRI